ncbi:MAG: efflux RND transporter periplasmic adaptor subunit [Vicinamibacterales bacterium]
MSRNKKLLVAAGVVIVLGGITFANFKFKKQTGIAVNVEAVRRRGLQQIVSASGKIQPHDLINISSDTVGRVTNLAVDEGMRVTKGQFLMQIDPKLLAAAADQQQASLEAAKSQMDQLRVAADSAEAALKLAQQEEARQQQLWKQGLTTKESVDTAESTLHMRQSDTASAAKQIEVQQLHMKEQQAMVDSAKYQLSKVRITAPIDGIITSRNIEEGETVVVGTMNNAGTVLLTIGDMSNIEAQVEVDETDIPDVQLGQAAAITIDAMPGKTFHGHVTEIGNSPINSTTTSASAATQATNFLVKVRVDDKIPDVRPGFSCTANITTATRTNALSIPIQATTVREVVLDKDGNVVHPQQKPGASRAVTTLEAQELPKGQQRKEIEGVFIVRDDKAVFTPVKTGIAGDKYFEALSGVKEGDQVVIGPFSSVRNLPDESAVKIEATPAVPAGGSST